MIVANGNKDPATLTYSSSNACESSALKKSIILIRAMAKVNYDS
jgi:hypothetical protein